ncbi:MAG: acyl-CoA thioesterase/BAAT N-terminal domain-containing protein [Propionibacteriaceae bacterium]|jgi:dienelactone hydrolase|nr:acyl-CoA thioesterase/BAAT N-terminal domain-containing protein [Propionibacteriaceae bacterium]
MTTTSIDSATTTGAAPALSVRPARALIDADTSVEVTGLPPRALARVGAAVDLPDGTKWRSHAWFVADRTGAIDLATATPLDGSYLVADPNGLVWSLAVTPDSPDKVRKARFIESDLEPYEIRFDVQVGEETVAEAGVWREPVGPGVTREEVRGATVGTLFLPPGPRRRGLVIVVPGSDGGVPEPQAALYASHGVASLALGYFRFPGVPETLEEIPLEYFDQAFDWAEGHPGIDSSRLIVNGTSRGGELALLLGAWFPQRVTAVLAWVPSNLVNRGFPKIIDSDSGKSAWTWRGEPLPYNDLQRGEKALELTRDGVPLRAIGGLQHLADRYGSPELAAAEIPVERINGPVVFISGRDDVLWPSAVYSDWAVERLHDHGFAHPVEHWSYENAGHTLGPANGPATILTSGDPGEVTQHLIHYGGTPQGIAQARADLWPKVLAFIDRHFAD